MKKYLHDKKNLKNCVIGLGYVGLPLAIEFGKKFSTIGFDVKKTRIKNLKINIDENNEIKKKNFISSKFLTFTSNYRDIDNSNFYIVCVPTPVNKKNIPDLTLLKSACLLLAKVIKKNDFVVFESTVYPGTTEEFCIPLIEKEFSKINKVKIKKGITLIMDIALKELIRVTKKIICQTCIKLSPVQTSKIQKNFKSLFKSYS